MIPAAADVLDAERDVTCDRRARVRCRCRAAAARAEPPHGIALDEKPLARNAAPIRYAGEVDVGRAHAGKQAALDRQRPGCRATNGPAKGGPASRLDFALDRARCTRLRARTQHEL